MIIYLLRHGNSEDHAARSSDAERRLTDEGREKTTGVLRAAHRMRLSAPELVVSSPLIRAIETADIACIEFAKGAKRLVSDVLVPSAEIDRTMAFVASHIKDHPPIMLVGHEPHLSTFAGALLGSSSPVIEMKKASLAAFELYFVDPIRMRALLTALLPPRLSELL